VGTEPSMSPVTLHDGQTLLLKASNDSPLTVVLILCAHTSTSIRKDFQVALADNLRYPLELLRRLHTARTLTPQADVRVSPAARKLFYERTREYPKRYPQARQRCGARAGGREIAAMPSDVRVQEFADRPKTATPTSERSARPGAIGKRNDVP
jgi:hypothetical protein